MTIGVVLALAAAAAYGLADFVGGVGSRRTSSWQVVFVGQLAGAMTMVVAGAWLPGDPTVSHLAWAIVAGVGTAMGSIFLYRGLARGRMGVVAPVSAVGAAVLPVVVGVALGERPALLVWVGTLIALPGIWLVSREGGGRFVFQRDAVADGAIAGAGFGLLFIALARIPEAAGTMPLAVNQLVGAGLTVVVARALGAPWRPSRGVVSWGAAAGALGALGTLAYFVATQSAPLAITAVMASLYPAVTVVLAAVVLREPMGSGQRMGLLVCTAAVSLVAVG